MVALSWTELETLTDFTIDRVNGPTNAQSNLRLFGHSEADVRVTLYRDHHAWCPYCQKVWLWLEEKQIPYRIRKVTMFCYGTKELLWTLSKTFNSSKNDNSWIRQSLLQRAIGGLTGT